MRFIFKRRKKQVPQKQAVTITKKNITKTWNLEITPYNNQHVGARNNQEDAFALSDFNNKNLVAKNGFLAVLADGMGGLDDGEKASQAAVDIFIREYNSKNTSETNDQFLLRTVRLANEAVNNLASIGGVEVDLGTTLVAVIIHENLMHWVSVGDSRIYIYRDGLLSQLTRDHIYAYHLAEQVKNGELSGSEAASHPERNHLTSFIGLPELVEIDYNEAPLQLLEGDKVLLCSDGLYDTLPDNIIIDILAGNNRNYAEEIVSQVLDSNNPYQDNVTVIVLDVASA